MNLNLNFEPEIITINKVGDLEETIVYKYAKHYFEHIVAVEEYADHNIVMDHKLFEKYGKND